MVVLLIGGSVVIKYQYQTRRQLLKLATSPTLVGNDMQVGVDNCCTQVRSHLSTVFFVATTEELLERKFPTVPQIVVSTKAPHF
jgi:hypothetical protein